MPPPVLEKPFWRFNVDTAEADAQYDLLLKAEQDGAEVYYAAPRFTSWDGYAGAFEEDAVLDRSLLIKPSEIDSKLAAAGEPDGWHRIVYDRSRVYVCSTPMALEEVRPVALADQVRGRILARGQRLDHALKQALESFGRRREIRMPSPAGRGAGWRALHGAGARRGAAAGGATCRRPPAPAGRISRKSPGRGRRGLHRRRRRSLGRGQSANRRHSRRIVERCCVRSWPFAWGYRVQTFDATASS